MNAALESHTTCNLACTATMTAPTYNAAIARFLRDEIGSPAEAYLDEVANTHANASVRKRAVDELKKYQP